VKDIFREGFWNATVVDRELGYASTVAVNSLRVFVTHGGYCSSGCNNTAAFMKNYQSFQKLAKARGLTLLVTLGTGERSPFGTCEETTRFVNAIVGAEINGAVIAYEADNEPSSYMIGYLTNCTLPALNAASRNPNVDISVGLAHVGEVAAVKNLVTTLNWHSYNGQNNGGGLYGEINELQKYVNKFDPPKQLVLTEWHARPAQPLAAAYPVIRDNKVAAYMWALVIVDCTSHWNRPLVPSDPPFQGLLWPNGSAYDDLEEKECLRSQCRTLRYVHHCCNNWHANGTMLDGLWAFSNFSNGKNSSGSEWQTKVFGSPVFKLPGPREGSMRWTNVSGASITIGPLPTGTKRVALYLPTSAYGCNFQVELDGKQIHSGTTFSNANESNWVGRTVLTVAEGKLLKLVVGKALATTTKFSISGVTLFTPDPPPPTPSGGWKICSVTSFGAIGDNHTNNKAAFHAAIQACGGGGTIVVPAGAPGLYITEPFNLTTNQALEVQPGAVILGIGYENIQLPPLPSMGGSVAAGGGGGAGLTCRYSPLVGAYNATNVTIHGGGTINGQGQPFWNYNKIQCRKPMMMEFWYVDGLQINNINIHNSPFWTLHPYM
jgi:hypothetical protein